MAVFDTRKIAAQQSGTLFDITLGHAFLQPVISDCLADIHWEEFSFTLGMLNSNQSSTVWQVEIRAIAKNFRVSALARTWDARFHRMSKIRIMF
jgi:hypothetical protein